MSYNTLKALVNSKVYENTEQRITGGDMNDVLQSAIASLGAHYQMGGLVSPTDHITVGDEPVVFIATTPGTYTYFGNQVVADGEVALLVWSGTAWSKQTPDIATRTEVSQLGQKVDDVAHGKKSYRKTLSVSSGSQQIALDESDFGKVISLRVASNSATCSNVAVGVRISGGTSTYHGLSANWAKIEKTTDIDRLYIYAENTTVAGDIVVEVAYKDLIPLYYQDSVPTQDSDFLVKSGGVFSSIKSVSERIENNDAYTKKIVGGQSSIIIPFISGVGMGISTKYPIFIPVGAKVRIRVQSNTVFQDNTEFPVYFWYSDGTRSSGFPVRVGVPSSEISVGSDVVALATYFTAPSVTSSGDVKVVIEFVETAFSDVYDEIEKQREVIPLRYIGTDSSLVNDWNIGEMYFDVSNNFIRRCISTTPLNFESINAKDTLYKVGDELFLFDGISLKRYYNNVLFDGEVIVDYPLYVVGPNYNNEGNNTYVYKTIADFPVSANDVILVSCSEVIGAESNSSITIYGMKNGAGTEIGYMKTGQKRIYPSTNYDSIKVRLYPTTNGMSAIFASYKNVRITKSKCGDIQIKKSLLEDFAVPAYYIKDNYLKNKISTIRSAIKASGGNYDAFVFCTDIHWTDNAKNSPAIIRYICKKVGIHRLFLGGDYADGINIDCNNAFNKAFIGRIYRVAGNHEYLNYFEEDGVFTQTDISDAEVWEYLNDGTFDAVSGNPTESYFYVDNPIQKMRYIILSVFSDGSMERFTNEQETWFRDVALNLPNGYTAIVFAHYFVKADFPTFDNKQFTTTGTKVATIVDAYNGSGEIACLIAGHTHYDLQTTTPGGIPVVATTCDKDTPTNWETTNQPEESAYIYGKRVRGTITEQAFDVVVVDKKNRLITFIRIGAPADVDGTTFAETRTASY